MPSSLMTQVTERDLQDSNNFDLLKPYVLRVMSGSPLASVKEHRALWHAWIKVLHHISTNSPQTAFPYLPMSGLASRLPSFIAP